MADYPKPNGYVGSGTDGNIMRQGSGGRLSLNLCDATGDSFETDQRRNPVGLDLLPGEEE